MTKSRYNQLQELTNLYGKESINFHRLVLDIGPKIVAAYDAYLGGPKQSASAVPPEGDFNPRSQYRGEAFDSHWREVIHLDAIRMGICTEIGNLSDSGATWVRTVLEFSPTENGLCLSIGQGGKSFRVDDDGGDGFSEIVDAIFEDARSAFSLELDEIQSKRRIGFLP